MQYSLIQSQDQQNFIENLDNQTVFANLIGAIYQVKYNKTGKMIAIASEDNYPIIHSKDIHRLTRLKPAHSATVLSIAFSSDSIFLAASCSDGNLKVYNIGKISLGGEAIEFENWSHRISKEIKTIMGGNLLRLSWYLL